MILSEIIEQSPDCSWLGGGKWAMYSMRCCWWTSFPSDLGTTADFKRPTLKEEYEKHLSGVELPCCPHCGGMLLQAPLDDFIAQARANPDHYGDLGLDIFVAAHSRNASFCFEGWKYYNGILKLRGQGG